MATYEQLWQALQQRVCVKCLDGNGQGGCRVSHDGFCALKVYFPAIIDVVNSVQSTSILPYEEQLRRRVCSTCKMQSPDGTCVLREHVDCALDRYFPLIVEVIEEEQRRAARVTDT
ncbi:MAG TPA: hypothetical protein VNL69_11130 [Bacteroidota bacterium]|nr:hypothetical protein [Bacteroidota bacterium]